MIQLHVYMKKYTHEKSKFRQQLSTKWKLENKLIQINFKLLSKLTVSNFK